MHRRLISLEILNVRHWVVTALVLSLSILAPSAFAQISANPYTGPVVLHDSEDPGEILFRQGHYGDAIALWGERSEAGDGYALYRLGLEYYNGMQVDRDLNLAREYHQRAARLGFAASMFEVGSYYDGGIGVDRNLREAGRWYLAAARRGFAPAQHNVATMFESGRGRERDIVLAYLYYHLAIEQGFEIRFGRILAETYEDPRERLERMMSERQLEAAALQISLFETVE